MNREEFEQLVSRWLDEPQREDLKAAVEEAAARSEELARLRDQWRRLDELIRATAVEPAGIDWQRLHRRILSAVRESTAVGAGLGRRDILRLVRRPVMVGLGLAAAAAILVMTLLPRPVATGSREGVARAWVGAPAATAAQGYAAVRLHVPDQVPGQEEPQASASGELFLMIEPPPPRSGLTAGLALVVPLADR